MIITKLSTSALLIILCFINVNLKAQNQSKISWKVNTPMFTATAGNSFDNISVKDPSIVFQNGKWHLFYSAFGEGNTLQIGYANAPSLSEINDSKRTMLEFSNNENLANKYAAPQVFYFEPHKKWYLIFQGYWNNVQPLYSSTDNIEDPGSWTQPKTLMPKFEKNSWVDFYVICDNEFAYLTYSRDYRSVYAVKTKIENFPQGFDLENPIMLIDDKRVDFGEAAHIYKAKGTDEYHMIYEVSDLENNKMRSYSLYSSMSIEGPWKVKHTDYAAKKLLIMNESTNGWPEEVSHGEMLRTNFSQTMEYDPVHVRFLMQGIISKERGENYTPDKYWMLPWKFGIIETTIKQ